MSNTAPAIFYNGTKYSGGILGGSGGGGLTVETISDTPQSTQAWQSPIQIPCTPTDYAFIALDITRSGGNFEIIIAPASMRLVDGSNEPVYYRYKLGDSSTIAYVRREVDKIGVYVETNSANLITVNTVIGYKNSGASGGSGTSWVFDVPEMHRNIFRGQSLGSSVTAAQLAAIADDSFDDLYVGDYWTTEFSYGGNTFNVNWRIADIDYYIGRGNPALTAHHLLIMPDCTLANAQLNSYAASAYYNTDMYATVLPALLSAIQSQFTDKILTFYDVYGTSTSDIQNRARQIEIPSSFMCLGSTLMSNTTNAIAVRTNFFDRIALFNICPEYLSYKAYTGATGNVDSYWTRTNGTNTNEWVVIGTRAGQADAADTFGVRPFFLLGDNS